MNYVFLGDVHGCVDRCIDVALANVGTDVIQIGDMGVSHIFNHGFVTPDFCAKNLPLNFKFFRGNHDNPAECRKIPHYLGDFGEFKDVFFVSGAKSYDGYRRVEGWTKWFDEELTYAQSNEALAAWCASKCTILASHDCPQSAARFGHDILDSTFTRELLDEMVSKRKPKICVYGHHHKSRNFVLDGINYICLDINESIDIDEKEFKIRL